MISFTIVKCQTTYSIMQEWEREEVVLEIWGWGPGGGIGIGVRRGRFVCGWRVYGMDWRWLLVDGGLVAWIGGGWLAMVN